MDSQLVDLGGSAVVLLLLWRIIASTKKDLNHRIDRQGEALKSDMAELKEGQADLKSDVADLKSDVVGLKAGQAGLVKDVADLKAGQARMGENILQLFGGLGEVRGELKRIAPRPRERVGAGGS